MVPGARALGRGLALAVAAEAFREIAAFAAFGFCQSHAAALAVTACETMHLKRYHPAAVRLGLGQVQGVGAERAERIMAARAAEGPFPSLAAFVARTGLHGPPVEALVLAGAFDHLDPDRRRLLWALYGLPKPKGPQARLPLAELPAPDLGVPGAAEQTWLDHAVLGVCLERHATTLYQRRLQALGVVPSARLARWPSGRSVRVGGMVVCRQAPPTAKGFVFLTLEDADGLMNVIVPPRHL